MLFLYGVLSTIALFALTLAARRRAFRRWAARRGPAAGLAGRRWPFRGLFARLATSPAQEQVLVDEAAAVREELRGLRAEWEAARAELAALLGEPAVDAARVEGVLAARDARLAAVRRRGAEAVARFHGVLDDAQRRALAGLVREGRLLAPVHARRHRC